MGDWIETLFSTVFKERWLFVSPRTAESAMTGSVAAMPWMGTARAAVNNTDTSARYCLMLYIIRMKPHKSTP